MGVGDAAGVGALGATSLFFFASPLEGEAAGSISPLAWSALNLAEVSIALDDPISAEAHMTRALTLMRQLGDAWGTTEALGVVAELAFTSGDVDRAATLYGELAQRAARTNDAPLSL